MKLTKLAMAISLVVTGHSLAYAAPQNLSVLRVINVPGTSATAQSCLVLSQELGITPDAAAPFASLTNLATGKYENPTLIMDGKSLCFTGLSYGNRYGVQLKKGLTASTGAVLKQNYNTEFTTGDRSSYFSFLPGNVISSADKERKIPVESVNYPEIKVLLFRVSLSDLSSYSNWSSLDLSSYRYGNISDLLKHTSFVGSKIYKNDGQPNKKNFTFVNLDDFAGRLPSGMYQVILTSPKAPDCDASLNCLADFYDESRIPMMVKRVIVSDLGVTTYSSDSSIDVATRSLNNGKPVADAKVTLFSAANEVLGTTKTDDNGYAKFNYEKINGRASREPTLITVTKGDDFYAVDLRSVHLSLEGLTMIDHTAKNPNFRVYSYFNRSLVRPGEKVFYEAIVRDQNLNAAKLKNLKLMIYRPDGMLFREVSLLNPRAGAFGYEFEFDKKMSTGRWRFDLGFDKNNVIDSKQIAVSNFTPSSVTASLDFDKDIITLDDIMHIKTLYTYGSPAGNIAISGSVDAKPDHHPVAKYKDYYFGPDESQDFLISQHLTYSPSSTDINGLHNYSFNAVNLADYPQKLNFTVFINDPNSIIMDKTISRPLLFTGQMIGFKAEGDKNNERLQKMHVILADQQGNLYSGKVNYRLFRQEVSYQFVYNDGRWDYIRNESRIPVHAGEVDVSDDGSTVIAHELDFGNYFVEIDGAGVPVVASFYAGCRSAVDPNVPDHFDLFANGKNYKAGDDLELEFDSVYDGYADLMIDSVNQLFHFKINKGHNRISVELPKTFVRGGYALLSTYSSEDNKYMKSRRSFGSVYIPFYDKDRLLTVSSDLPATVKPNAPLDIKIKVDGADDNTFITATLIDEGILSINNQEASQPEKFIYNGKEFRTKIYDDYGYVMKSAGKNGQGYGDEGMLASGESLSSVTENLMSYYTQEVQVKDGVATVHFDLKDLSSTARFDVSAWSDNRLGSLSTSVAVKDNTVTKLSMPKFMRSGDISFSNLLIHNLQDKNGEYTYSVTCSGALECELSGKTKVSGKTEKALPVTVTAKGSGNGYADIKIQGPDYSFTTRKTYDVLERYIQMNETRMAVLKSGAKQTLALNNGFVPDTNAKVRYGNLPLADINTAVKNLIEGEQYGVKDNAAAGLAALELLNVLEKSPDSDKSFRDELARFVQDKVISVVMALDSSVEFITEYCGNYENSQYTYAYVANFLIRAAKSGFNVSTHVQNGLYSQLKQMTISEKDNLAALSLSTLMLTGENVRSSAIYAFDRMMARETRPLEAFATFAEIFDAYGDTNRRNTALKEGELLAKSVNQKISKSLSGKTPSEILALTSNIAAVLPFDVNTFNHDILSLIRAKVKSGSQNGLEELFSYLKSDLDGTPSDLAVLAQLSTLSKDSGESTEKTVKLVDNQVTLTNSSNKNMVATVTVDGYVKSPASNPVVNVYPEYYDASGNELPNKNASSDITLSQGDDLLVIQRIVFNTEYSGVFEFVAGIPANTMFMKMISQDELNKKYPNLKNIKITPINVTAGETELYFSDYATKAKSIVIAYVLKGSHPGKTSPIMTKGRLKKAVPFMFSGYNRNHTLTVK